MGLLGHADSAVVVKVLAVLRMLPVQAVVPCREQLTGLLDHAASAVVEAARGVLRMLHAESLTLQFHEAEHEAGDADCSFGEWLKSTQIKYPREWHHAMWDGLQGDECQDDALRILNPTTLVAILSSPGHGVNCIPPERTCFALLVYALVCNKGFKSMRAYA